MFALLNAVMCSCRGVVMFFFWWWYVFFFRSVILRVLSKWCFYYEVIMCSPHVVVLGSCHDAGAFFCSWFHYVCVMLFTGL